MPVTANDCLCGLVWKFGLALGLAAAALTTGDTATAWAEPEQSTDVGSSDGAAPAGRTRPTRPAGQVGSRTVAQHYLAHSPVAAPGTPTRLSGPLGTAVAAPPPLASRTAVQSVQPTAAPGTGAPMESPLSWMALSAVRRWGRPSTDAWPNPAVAATVSTAQAAARKRFNRPPVISSVVLGNPDSTNGAVTGTVTATDPNGDRLTYRATTPVTGTVAITTGTTNGVFTYTPTATARHAAAKVGGTATTDSVTVTVTDARGAKATTTVTVPISPNNALPTAKVSVGTPNPSTGVVTGSVTATDADLDPLTYSAPAGTDKGTISLNAGTGAFTYTPTAAARHNAALIGGGSADKADTFTVTIADGYGGVVIVPVTVAIGSRNAAPIALTTTVGSPDSGTGVVTGSVAASDSDGDTLTYTGSTTTAKGAVTVSATGGFTYTPTPGARDNAAAPTATSADKLDTFTVIANDSHGGTTDIAVTVAVSPSSSAPPPQPDPGATGHMAVGMNLENVVDWSPAWTFTDAFKASRPWISQTFNPQTWALSWDDSTAPLLDLDADGNVKSLKTWTQNGVTMKQYAGTLMFRGLGGNYAGGTYHAEWDGTGVVTFGFDAVVTSSGETADGRNFAELAVTPTDNGIYMRIEETSPTDPVRNFNIWMPDYNGQSFRGQRWEPGADFSPFHPLFLARLDSFTTLRFMGMQETNTSDIVTWDQRRDANDIRQGSGSGGTPSEPIVNGMSLEYMVELANELDADPWFNMPYQADDTFVRNFATYVSQNLEPGRTVYVEWANEVWNFGWGFEASQWVAGKAEAAGLDPDYGQWIVAGQEAKRDMDIWSEVFATQSDVDLVRVAGGWAAVDWVTNQVLENMGGSFDAIAIAPYITPTDAQRAGYTSATTVDRIIADTRTNVATSVQWTADHELLAQQWSAELGRPIELVAYEGGPHLDGRGAPYQNAFYAATNDARMGDIYGDYLRALDAAGLDLFMDFQFTGQAGAAPWGDFAKLHRMDQSLATAYRYNAVVSAANGSLWNA